MQTPISTRTENKEFVHRHRTTGEELGRYNVTREIDTYATDKGDLIEVSRTVKKEKIEQDRSPVEFTRAGANWMIKNVPADARKGNWVSVTRQDGTTAQVRLVGTGGNGTWSFVDQQRIEKTRREVGEAAEKVFTDWGEKLQERYVNAVPVTTSDGQLEINGVKITDWKVGGYVVTVFERETSLGPSRQWVISETEGYRPLVVDEKFEAYHQYGGRLHRTVYSHDDGADALRVQQLLLRRAV